MSHTAKEILDLIDEYLEQEIRKDRPSPHDIDYFRLFAEAYNQGYFERTSSPRLTADAFTQDLDGRSSDETEHNRIKIKKLNKLAKRWREWQYAWDNVNLLEKIT